RHLPLVPGPNVERLDGVGHAGTRDLLERVDQCSLVKRAAAGSRSWRPERSVCGPDITTWPCEVSRRRAEPTNPDVFARRPRLRRRAVRGEPQASRADES